MMNEQGVFVPDEGRVWEMPMQGANNVEQTAEDLMEMFGMDHEALPYFRAMSAAMYLFRERSDTYGHSWRRHGALGNLLKLDIKARRLMRGFWFKGEDAAPTHKDEGDDALDAMNYAAFFYGCLDMGLMKGVE